MIIFVILLTKAKNKSLEKCRANHS